MTVSHLEQVVKYMYENRRYQKIEEIHKKVLQDSPILDLLIVLNKLAKDGYLTVEKQKQYNVDQSTGVKKNKITRKSYFISFEGILFYENVQPRFLHRPYRNEKAIKRIQAAYITAKIIMTILNAAVIIWLTYLSIKKS